MSISGEKIENIGSMIAYVRSKNKLTQKDFAEKIGVSRTIIGEWENGRSIPPTKKVSLIAETFGISIIFDEAGGVAFNENRDTD